MDYQLAALKPSLKCTAAAAAATGCHKTIKRLKIGDNPDVSNADGIRKLGVSVLLERASSAGVGVEMTDSTSRKSVPATSNAAKVDGSTKETTNLMLNFNEMFAVDVANRYGVLSDPRATKLSDDMDTTPVVSQEDANTDAEETTAKGPKPPPICFVARVVKSQAIFRQYCDSITKNYYLQYSKDRTFLYYRNVSDYKRFIEKYKGRLPFYTYTPRQDKTHAYLIKGLHDDALPEEIMKELRENNLNVINVVKFKNTRYPIFMCVVGKQVSLKDLQEKARYLLRTKVYYENHVNKRELTQCKRCQVWGHATSNCYLGAPRCVKCAGEHNSYECTKSREEPAKCRNCEKDHPASSLECEVYLAELEEKRQRTARSRLANSGRRDPPPNRYVSAPLPSRNAWTQKREQQVQQPAETNVRGGVQPRSILAEENFPPLPRTRDSRQEAASSSGGGGIAEFGAMAEISQTMSEINQLCDLRWLANILKELKAEMAKCRTVVEYALTVDAFNAKYSAQLRCP